MITIFVAPDKSDCVSHKHVFCWQCCESELTFTFLLLFDLFLLVDYIINYSSGGPEEWKSRYSCRTVAQPAESNMPTQQW